MVYGRGVRRPEKHEAQRHQQPSDRMCTSLSSTLPGRSRGVFVPLQPEPRAPLPRRCPATAWPRLARLAPPATAWTRRLLRARSRACSPTTDAGLGSSALLPSPAYRTVHGRFRAAPEAGDPPERGFGPGRPRHEPRPAVGPSSRRSEIDDVHDEVAIAGDRVELIGHVRQGPVEVAGDLSRAVGGDVHGEAVGRKVGLGHG